MTNIPLDCTLLAKPNSEHAPPLLLVSTTTRRWMLQRHHAYFATFPYVQTTHHGAVLAYPFAADNFRTFVRMVETMGLKPTTFRVQTECSLD